MFQEAIDRTENSTVNNDLTVLTFFVLVAVCVVCFFWLLLALFGVLRSKRIKIARPARETVHVHAISTIEHVLWDEAMVR